MEPDLGGQEKGSRFFGALATSIAHVRERWVGGGVGVGCWWVGEGVKPALTRVRALPGGGLGTRALAWVLDNLWSSGGEVLMGSDEDKAVFADLSEVHDDY